MAAVPAKKILVIDDDIDIRRILVVFLQSVGYEVETAPGAAEGIDLAIKNNPDLIILDVLMPTMNGWEVLSQLRNLTATAKTPVLMLTAEDQMKSVETAFSLGANSFLAKPIHATRLHKKVAELLTPKTY